MGSGRTGLSRGDAAIVTSFPRARPITYLDLVSAVLARSISLTSEPTSSVAYWWKSTPAVIARTMIAATRRSIELRIADGRCCDYDDVALPGRRSPARCSRRGRRDEGVLTPSEAT